MSETKTMTDTTPIRTPEPCPDATWPAMRAAGYVAAGFAVDAGEWTLTMTDDTREQCPELGPGGSWRMPVAVRKDTGEAWLLKFLAEPPTEDDERLAWRWDWDLWHYWERDDAPGITALLDRLYRGGQLALVGYEDGVCWGDSLTPLTPPER